MSRALGRHRRSPAGYGIVSRGLEPLEERRLLATDVIINEFVADSSGGLKDPNFPADTPDWIELYNPKEAAVPLGGWKLKDSNNTWTFPFGASIPAKGYFVVFADSKNLADVTKPLHTNFGLSNNGEYLALLRPDNTIAHEYTPEFPEQNTDVSYGISVETITEPLVTYGSQLKTLVPTDGSLGTDWRSDTFVDTTWAGGTRGVGFENDAPLPAAPAGWTVRMLDTSAGPGGGVINNINTAKSLLNGNTAGWTFTQHSHVVPDINYMDTGGHYGPNRALPNGLAPNTAVNDPARNQYVLRATTFVTIPNATSAPVKYTIGVNSNEGFQLTMPGVVFTNRSGENTSLAPSGPDQLTYSTIRPSDGSGDTTGTFIVPPGGLQTSITVDYFEGTGNDNLEVFVASGERTGWVVGTYPLLTNTALGWQVRTENPQPPFTGMFGVDLKTPMLNTNNTAYVRIPFGVTDPTLFTKLMLHMKYDDGFVAYINGQQVASANAPGALDWNSSATGDHLDPQSVIDQDFEIPVTPGLLKVGENILAIQALNSAADPGDFLMVPTLDGLTGQIDVERYFGTPTPNAANTNAFVGRIEDTSFSHDRGFYTAPFLLTITTDTPDAQIRYTTNGSTPTQASTLYTGPITINKTTTLRAIAFKGGHIPSNVDTQTYIFLDDVVTQAANGAAPPGWPTSWGQNIVDYGMDPDIVNSPTYGPTIKNDLRTIPSFSIVTEMGNLFDPSIGIYANPNADGPAWERPASVELIYPDGTEGFQINAGLRLRGGYSRSTNNPKHAFRFLFRPEYGDSSLEYDLFKSQNGTTTFDGFDLRTFQNYSWSFDPGGGGNFIAMRDQFSRDTQNDMGYNAERGDYYHLYVNGMYWGVFNTAERPEASYAASYYGGQKEDYDVIKVEPDAGYVIEPTDGNLTGWQQFWTMSNQVRSLAAGGNVQGANDLYQQLMGNNPDGTRNAAYPIYLDPENLIDYMLVIFYGGNLDAPISNFIGNSSPNNWYGSWNRVTKDKGWQFYAHDSEHTLLNTNENRLGPYPAGSSFDKSNPQWIFQQLLYSPEFRLKVQDQVHKHLFNNGTLTTQSALARLNNRRDEINRAIVGESARWGDSKSGTPFTHQNWVNNVNNVINGFINSRTANLLNQFRNSVMGSQNGQNFTVYPTLGTGLEAPEFLEKFGGIITPGDRITITRPAGQGTIYYTLDGSDPRMIGGAVSPGALAAPADGKVTLSDTAMLSARIRLGNGNWSPLTRALFTNVTPPPVRVSEMMYHAADAPVGSPYAEDDFEYVEVQNISAAPLALTGYKFTNGITFTFPEMTLAPGERTLVVANLAAFQSRYGQGLPIAGVYTGNLSNSGERITLAGKFGETIHTFSYNDNWHPHTDGDGFSMVATNTSQNVNLYGEEEGWRGSATTGGDPGTFVASLNPRSIAINEIAANVATPNTTWIELKNTTNQAIDISGWFLSNAGNTETNLKKYEFPDGTVLQPGAFLVLNEQETYGAASQGTKAFTLNKHGGEIFLTQADPDGNLLGYREIQDYDEADLGKTQGRYVKSNGAQDYPLLGAPTPGAENDDPIVGPVVINEVMYSPTGTGVEWVEIRNITDQAVQLFDPANPANTWKFTQGIEFAFPTNQTLDPLQFALIVPIDPNTFRTQYNIPASVKIFGPYTGFLDNTGETIRLSRPGVPYQRTTPTGTETVVPNIHVDRLNYNNRAPWPITPDGAGPTLIRKNSSAYGNDVANWQASSQNGGSPGVINLNSVPLLVGGPDVTLNEGQTFAQGGSFTDADTGQTHTAEVNWGDFGATQPLALNPDGTYALDHVFADNGTYNVRVRVIDNAGGFTDDFITVTVNNVAPTATFAVQGPTTANEGATKRVVFSNQTDPSSIDVNAGFTYSYDWNNDGVFELVSNSSAIVVIPTSITGDGPRVQTMRARIIDKNGGFTDYTATLTVNNSVPQVDPIEDAQLAGPGVFTYTGSFFDVSSLDTFTGSVDWDYHPGDTDAEPVPVSSEYTFDLQHNFTSGGTYLVRVVIKDDDGGEGVRTFNVTVPGGDNTAPAVQESAFHYLTGPRKVSVKFSEDVSASLAREDLAVTNSSTGQNVDPATMTFGWDAGTLTATWTFDAPLDDGNYTATILSDNVSDGSGNKLDGDGNGAAGGDFILPFFFLGGDSDHDRDVDFNDLVSLAQNYNTTGKTFAQGNFDGDAAGAVGFADLVILAQRYGKTLAAPGAAAGESLAAQTAQPLPFTIAQYQADPAGTIARTRPGTPAPVKRPAPVAKPAPKAVAAKAPVAKASTPAPAAAPITTFSSKRIAVKPAKRNDLLA